MPIDILLTKDSRERHPLAPIFHGETATPDLDGLPQHRLPRWTAGVLGQGLTTSVCLRPTPYLDRLGFRFGARGTQSSRSIMLRELSELLDALPPDASRADYKAAIVEENVLAKPTRSTRLKTDQCLTQLYGLDPEVPLFRVLRRLWAFERGSSRGRRLLGLLTALARDPLLRITAGSILGLGAGEELVRTEFAALIRRKTGSRFNGSVLNRVAINAATSWTQSGHLEGRMRKIRCKVSPTPAAVSLALWLGEAEGLEGLRLIDSHWAAVLDLPGGLILENATRASRLGLIRLRAAGTVVEVSTQALDPNSPP